MLQRIVHRTGLVGYRSPGLAQLGVPHLFTTRVGLGGAPWDLRESDERVLAVLRECAGAGLGAPLVSMKQVHGAAVHELGASDGPLEGDAWTSGRGDALALVYTADCVPVLVASADGARVAAIHAGWRGIIAGVIPAALARLGVPAACAAIGPCLSLESCEMGPEVAQQFVQAGLRDAVHERAGARPRVDLRAAARMQLERAGCTSVDVSDRCTYLHADELPSHRREVTHGGAVRAGRICAFIAARTR
jgi:YfiH family protein